jgi:hypothetical protein
VWPCVAAEAWAIPADTLCLLKVQDAKVEQAMSEAEVQNETARWIIETKAKVAKEIKQGGTLAPCPFCRLPRCERSDYIRCSRCGLNWSPGDNLDKHPHNVRMDSKLDAIAAK